MKTEQQIINEWMSKDSQGLNWTKNDRIIFAMREFSEQGKCADSQDYQDPTCCPGGENLNGRCSKCKENIHVND